MKLSTSLGRWLFRYRSVTPLPLILLILFLFSPRHYGKWQLSVSLAAVGVSILGEMIRMFTVGYAMEGTSGRESFLRADGLNRTGAYSLVRNPLYLGNFLMHSGLLLFWGNPFSLLLMLSFLILQYQLIVRSEEAYLIEKHGDAYRDYLKGTRRFLPHFSRYLAPRGAFNWMKVFRKENDSIFNMIAMFLILIALREKRIHGSVVHADSLLAAGGLLLILYIVAKFWKKRGERKR